MALSPSEKSMRARIAAHARWSKYDSREHAAKMRAAGPAGDAYWLDRVDPERVLDPADRERRAKHAKAAHYARLQFASVRARARKSAGEEATP